MKLTKYLLILTVISVIFASCSDRQHEKKKAEELSRLETYIDEQVDAGVWVRDSVHKTESGMYIIKNVEGKGQDLVAYGDVVYYRFVGMDVDSTEYYQNWDGDYENPSTLTYTGAISSYDGFPNDVKGFIEGIGTMKGGDNCTFLIPSTLGYGQNKTNGVPGYTTLSITVKITNLVQAE